MNEFEKWCLTCWARLQSVELWCSWVIMRINYMVMKILYLLIVRGRRKKKTITFLENSFIKGMFDLISLLTKL